MTNRSFTAIPKLLAVIGDPIAHSLSPAMHQAAIDALHLNYLYVACHVRPSGLRRFIEELRKGKGLAGFNVTLPHKEKILSLLNGVTPLAKAVGAVNTVFWKGGKLWGTNTDVDGFALSVKALGVPLKKKTACVFGAGGASRAVLFALGRLGFDKVVVVNRTPARAQRLVRDIESHFAACTFSVLPWEGPALEGLFPHLDFLINTTPLGLKGEEYSPLPIDKCRTGAMACDILYHTAHTPFLAQAKAGGLRCQNGISMFVNQGALAFKVWTGREAPIQMMEVAVKGKGA